MSLDQATIEFILFDQLRYYHKPGTAIDQGTMFNVALDDGTMMDITAYDIYKNSCRYSLYINGGGTQDWPEDWLTMNCTSLAAAIAKRLAPAVPASALGQVASPPTNSKADARRPSAKTGATT